MVLLLDTHDKSYVHVFSGDQSSSSPIPHIKSGFQIGSHFFIGAPGMRMNYRVQVPNPEDRSRG